MSKANQHPVNKLATTVINKHVQSQIPAVFVQIRDALLVKMRTDQLDFSDLAAVSAYLESVTIDPIKVSSFVEELF